MFFFGRPKTEICLQQIYATFYVELALARRLLHAQLFGIVRAILQATAVRTTSTIKMFADHGPSQAIFGATPAHT